MCSNVILVQLSYNFSPNTVKYSKRAILSEIVRIYDPLRLLTPITTELKRLMKYLWSIELGWDDVIPGIAVATWMHYRNELSVFASEELVSFWS